MAADRPVNLPAHRLELFTRWADDLAHEVKNPLHAMVINLELIKRKAGGDPAVVVQRAEVVESELHRVHSLVDSLLRLVRPWPDTRITVVHDVISALLPVIEARAHLQKVTFTRDRAELRIRMAPVAFVHLLIGLLDRAIEAAGPGGAVELRLRHGEGHGLLLTVTGDAPELEQGPGLATVQKLVRDAGGELDLREGEAGRIRLVVELPAHDAA